MSEQEEQSYLGVSPLPEPAAAGVRREPERRMSRIAPWMVLRGIFIVVVVLFVVSLVASYFINPDGDSKKASYTLANPGTLTVAASLDNAPYGYWDNGQPAGFDVAVIQEVANRLGLACDIQDAKFSTIVSAVAAGNKYDVGVAALETTAERCEKVSFSNWYCIADQAIVVRTGTLSSDAKLKGNRVAVRSGTTGYTYVRDNTSAKPVVFGTVDECTAALKNKKVSAMVVDAATAQQIAASDDSLEVLERVATSDGVGIAISQENPGLKQAIDEVLEQMETDGTLANLRTQYGVE